MDVDIPASVRDAAGDRRSGASEIALTAVEGLLEIAGGGDPAGRARRLSAAAELLLDGQPAMAPVWHLARAAQSQDPVAALTRVREALLTEADEAVRVTRAWLEKRVGSEAPVATVSHSSLVDRVLEGRPRQEGLREGGHEGPRVAVMGADAIGPAEVLNATGSLELVQRLPTLVVATSVKLVPGEVFERLAAPGFERVVLEDVAAVALGSEVVRPEAAGRRATEIAWADDTIER
jgi:hypothetical protein